MDPQLLRQFMDAGRLPNLATLAQQGAFTPLQTTNPAESPVAWAAFATGMNPGQTGLFGFLQRDPTNYQPRYAPVTARPGKSLLQLLPLALPAFHNNRKGRPFWQIASEQGRRGILFRSPESFPPVKIQGGILAGMEVPDLRGTTGTFAFYTTDSSRATGDARLIHVHFRDRHARSMIRGPKNWLRQNGATAEIPLLLERMPQQQALRLQIGNHSQTLHPGEWSDWFEMSFPLTPFTTVHGIGRFYLDSLSPELNLYLSPIQADPRRPALPIASPPAFAAQISRTAGLYKTLGWQLDTWAVNEGYLPEKAFLADAFASLRQEERIALSLLEQKNADYILFFFDGLDRLQHMFWRYLDRRHPFHPAKAPPALQKAIEEYYAELDRIVGALRAHIGENTLLLVFSDHGFVSYRRSFNLNTWLRRNGYQALQDESANAKKAFLTGVDWQRTRAYSLGMGGVYINLAGRERDGIVAPGREYEALRRELADKLMQFTDPASGAPVVSRVALREDIYAGAEVAQAPDLVVGLEKGYRISQKSSLGGIEQEICSDNLRRWSGDHATVDPALVPGVLLANHRLPEGVRPSLLDLAPTILGWLEVSVPARLEGQSLFAPQDTTGLTASGSDAAPRISATGTTSKIMLIGLDGADWNRILPLVRQGKLPAFARLLREGASGELHPQQPLISPMIWTTIATGVDAEAHGIFDFLVYDEKTGKQIPVSRNFRRRKAIWNILSDLHKTVGVVGWLVTWPAEKVNGVMVSDRLSFLDFAPLHTTVKPGIGMTYPRDLLSRMHTWPVKAQDIPHVLIRRFLKIPLQTYRTALAEKQEPIWSAAAIIAGMEIRRNLARELLANRSFDLFGIYFKGIDSFSHLFAAGTPVAPAADRAIEAFYIYQDEVLAELLEHADAQTTVIVVSDHGFKLPGARGTSTARIGSGRAVDWHRDRGIVLLAGHHIREHAQVRHARDIDIAPTILYLMGLPVAEDLPGRVLREAVREEFLHAHPVQHGASYESGRQPVDQVLPVASGADTALRAQLETLGYLNPETANSYNVQGNYYMHRGDYQKAVVAFKKAIARQPEVAAFHDNLGNALTAAGKPQQALPEHQKAIALDPGNYKAYNNLGIAFFELGRLAQARQAYEKAIALNPEFAQGYSNLANVMAELDEPHEADALLRKAVQLDSSDARTQYNFGIFRGRQGRHREALRAFEKVLQIDPFFTGRADVYNQLGIAHFKLQEYDRAIAAFSTAIELGSEDPDIYNRLGLALLMHGDLQKAEAAFKTALAQNPQNPRTRQMLQELQKARSAK